MEMTLSAIKRIENRAKQIPGVISLAQGIPSFASHPFIREAVIKAIKDNKVDKYSPVAGLLELRRLFSAKLSQKGMFYNPDCEIIVTSGVIEALSATLLALVAKKDEVIILTPAYPYYQRIIQMTGAKTVEVPLSEKNGWSLNVQLLEKKITSKTKAIIICNPNNPTGSILSQNQLLDIALLAQKHNFFIILDDIYEKFYYGKKPPFNLCKQQEFKKQIIRIIGLSKDFAMSGWRIGLLHADNTLVRKILPTHDNLINCAPVISQYAALAALEKESQIIPVYMRAFSKRRKIMGSYLHSLKEYLSFIWPRGSYYFFPKIIGAANSERLCFDMLEKEGVAVVPGEDFGLGGKGHIRLCFGKEEFEIHDGMKRLGKYFQSRKRAHH